MIIGIDHGNLQIKTQNCVFTTGIKGYSYNIGFGDVLEYGGKFFTLSPERIPYMIDKTRNEKFYILTLIAIAKEIEARKAPRKTKIDLAIGLPPGEFTIDKIERFVKYFSRRKNLNFTYAKKEYNITIDSVSCYMQGYSAMLYEETKNTLATRGCVIDVGGYTVDFIDFRNGVVEPSQLRSFNKGIINLNNDIEMTVRAVSKNSIREEDIYDVWLGESSFLKPGIKSIIMQKREEYAKEVIEFVSEQSIWDLALSNVYFVGGGAVYLKPILENSENFGSVTFIDDICGNAKGYELQLSKELNESDKLSVENTEKGIEINEEMKEATTEKNEITEEIPKDTNANELKTEE